MTHLSPRPQSTLKGDKSPSDAPLGVGMGEEAPRMVPPGLVFCTCSEVDLGDCRLGRSGKVLWGGEGKGVSQGVEVHRSGGGSKRSVGNGNLEEL